MSLTRPAAVVVLAAGEGTRMKSRTPKVLHGIGGRSLLGHALTAARGVDPQRLAVVVRHERDAVAAHAVELDRDVLVVDQDEVPGTGRAVQCALGALDAAAHAASLVHAEPGHAGESAAPVLEGAVVVMAGDTPLLDAGTLTELLRAHAEDGNAVTVLTTTVDNPYGYGRVLREGGAVVGVVEERDATPEQREIREINTSTYVFDAAVLREALGAVGQDNDQGEVYLTDVVALAHRQGLSVRAISVDDSWLVEGVNDRAQLAALGAELNRRTVESWMREGVTVVDPATTWIDVDVELARDVTVLPGTQLHGATRVGEGSTVGPDTTLTDVTVGAGVSVVRTHGSEAVLDDGATVGPFAYLRPGTHLGPKGKIGTFVETKNAQIGAGSKVPHLTYVGDAEIGEGTNIGASSVFVNYDGVSKHRTVIGSHARTGSDNMFVAPVTVGDGAYTGAGTTIREDVPPGALSVTGAAQRIIEGWVLRRRPGTAAARAAEKALADGGAGLSAQARAERARTAGGSAGTTTPRDHQAPGTTDEGDTQR
ncbi:bifunctional UDP-N-acetylglucosamine diphosphorylase/glucosamine-1-phosphate N-acetyltransferase GlmU [Georgenia sp. EYE_87]|uniref:bifunctional UDP-N-acetylglucosamine diphosphorylase/glucosamine-1-phosphate N-acetyltransferase GlmU n=1 Tax=Georgenia sp. EYE_87 TaxID=2853448 RepID=UPI002003BAFF|nr:bifunctional UDP-N-acetylglucosamine diphosphorylase/glucosamine-1-phosphate N-acetyltransferase GlmU [Georgenia sp. EYE_87]MCK6211024.1 bifunctional UDP-N-acetylglucosamine diphosphorylase/glucosamine-1-phosphate N-acetyltransferase GlmU [Georgenia sp. EYE_87]